jgi:hypothetical protein
MCEIMTKNLASPAMIFYNRGAFDVKPGSLILLYSAFNALGSLLRHTADGPKNLQKNTTLIFGTVPLTVEYQNKSIILFYIILLYYSMYKTLPITTYIEFYPLLLLDDKQSACRRPLTVGRLPKRHEEIS